MLTGAAATEPAAAAMLAEWAPALGQAVEVSPQVGGGAGIGHGFDGGPAHQARASLGHPPPGHLDVGLAVLGRKPGPRAQLLGC